ncbi:helix-turn-helix domain-containing protein [Streptomyces sp. NBC_00079]|uniref:helix-turn-helix domain-containing protein n=1 Tax=Streptomyces sp. NBC_00079 TaxID=2975644 RepID=UPI00324BB05B
MPSAAGRPTLAERLEALFDEIRPEGPKGRRYTNDEVAAALREGDPGLRVSGAYLSALRNGAKRNPSLDLLAALARFFRVSVSYFLESATEVQAEAEVALAKVGHHPEVRNLALRALELTPEGLAIVTQIVEHVLTKDRDQNSADPDASRPHD